MAIEARHSLRQQDDAGPNGTPFMVEVVSNVRRIR